MTLHEHLSRMVESALPGTLVPVSSLRELLETHQPESRNADPGLSLEEVAERCAARGNRRKPVGTATVRRWIRSGLRGVKLKAFPLGMSYRVTEDALAGFIFALQGEPADAENEAGKTVRPTAHGNLAAKRGAAGVHPASHATAPHTIEDDIAAARARYSRTPTNGSRSGKRA
jgi:hypothetical protein